MRSQYTLTAGLLGILMSLVSPVSLASLLSEDSAVKSEYMEAQRDSEVYA
ncbi:polysaccharide deacetylase family protein, partial [Enterobacteriaceae bacterium 8376wG6]|nr:polysaccharide deacetylase family protein [Enterobacteriaceae bacterium 8376wG6]